MGRSRRYQPIPGLRATLSISLSMAALYAISSLHMPYAKPIGIYSIWTGIRLLRSSLR